MTISRIFGRAILEIGLFSMVINILLLVQPIYLLQVYDRVLAAGSIETLVYITMIALAGLGVLGLLESVRSIYAARVANRLDAALAGNAVFLSLYSPKAASGDIQAVQDLSAVRNFINSKTLFYLFDLPFAPLFLILLYFVHPMLFFVTLAGALILVGLMVANQFATARMTADHSRTSYETIGLAQIFARNSDTIRALGMTLNVVEFWGGRMSETISQNDRLQQTNSWFSAMSRFVRLALQIAILGIGAYYVLKGEMTAGMIFASSIISGRALQPMDQIIGVWRQVQTTWTSAKRLMPLAKIQMQRRDDEILLPAPMGAVTADNLTYILPQAQPGAEPLINQVSFVIRPGECVGIIGPSGAGKSTLARLIAGALRPSRGSVAYDKADIAQWRDADRGKHVGYLGQDIEFLPGSISQNISRFEPNVAEGEVIKAARHAGAHDLIVSRPKGYSTDLGPGGERLSAGERQRIGLARAFFGNPSILILDEPNSNLDNDGQMALDQAIAGAKAQGKTVIVVLHRGPLMRLCDRLMVIRAGKLDLFGPTEAVLQRLVQPNQQPTPQSPSPQQPPQQAPSAGNGATPHTGTLASPVPPQSSATDASPDEKPGETS